MMTGAALAVVVTLVAGARLLYPRLLERRAGRRRPVGPDGVIAGAAAIDMPRPGAPAVLLLHGGGDTPQVLGALAAHLHDQGYSTRVPLLAGHGRTLAEFAAASSRDWERDVEHEYQALRATHPRVYVVGLSMGGALALALAQDRSEIPALVLLAPYVDMPASLRRLARASAWWGWMLPYVPSLGRRSIHDRAAAARTLGHGIMAPAALRGLYEVMLRARDALPRVTVPTLVVQSREDNRIAAASAQAAFDGLGASEKRLVWIEGAGHVITVDYGYERVLALVSEWLRAHPGHKSPATPARPPNADRGA